MMTARRRPRRPPKYSPSARAASGNGRPTAEGGQLCQHNAWYGLRAGMQPCPGAGLAPAEAVAA